MQIAPASPDPAVLAEAGRQIREAYRCHSVAIYRTDAAANSRWNGVFEDVVLTHCVDPVDAVLDFGEGRRSHRLLQGEFRLAPAGAMSYAHAAKPHQSVFCALPVALFEAHQDSGLALHDLRTLFSRAFTSPVITVLINELWAEARAGNPHGRMFNEAAASMLVFALARAGGHSPVIHRGGLTPRQMKDTLARIEASLESGVTLADLAAGAGLSLWHFSRAFHTTAGVTVKDFITRRRVEEAQRLLATGRISVLDAALATGFSSTSHFAKVFRRHTGQSPRDWIRSLR